MPPSVSATQADTLKVTSRAQAAIVTVQVPHHYVWTWDYPIPMPADNISFSLEGSTNLVDWYQIVDTNQPPVPYDSYQPNEYFRVGAHWIIDPNL